MDREEEPVDRVGPPAPERKAPVLPPPRQAVTKPSGVKGNRAELRRVRWRRFAPEGVAAALVIWLAWLLLSSPTIVINEHPERTESCQPIVRQVRSFPVSPWAVYSGDATSDYVMESKNQLIGDETNEFTQARETAARHGASVIIASCQEARANRQTEANVVMLVIAVVLIPRLCRRTFEKTGTEPSNCAPTGERDDQV